MYESFSLFSWTVYYHHFFRFKHLSVLLNNTIFFDYLKSLKFFKVHNFYVLYTEIALVNFQSKCVCVYVCVHCLQLTFEFSKFRFFLGCFFFCRGGELFINLVLKHHQNLLRLSKQTNKKKVQRWKQQTKKNKKIYKILSFIFFFFICPYLFLKETKPTCLACVVQLVEEFSRDMKRKKFFLLQLYIFFILLTVLENSISKWKISVIFFLASIGWRTVVDPLPVFDLSSLPENYFETTVKNENCWYFLITCNLSQFFFLVIMVCWV